MVAAAVFIAATLILWGFAELVQGLVVGERAAARAALRDEYEHRLIDADGLAKGLRAIDEAA